MDFHSLTRKELQTLCKQNKIPANMTNVAMADSLAALQFVEGLDGLRNQSQWPEKTVATESPLIPQTADRTSTRKKSIKEAPETMQPMTRTRSTTRKPLDKGLEQENQNANVAETPAVPVSRRRSPAASASKKMGTQVKDNVEKEMSCGVETETPMAQTGRRRVAQVGSTRRKLAEESVQRVYSTRRSVRLLEKTLVDLSLKDAVKEEPVKMVSLNETEEKDCSEVSLEKSNDSEVSLGVSFLRSLENESQLKEVRKDEKSNGHEKENFNVSTQDFVNSDNVSVVDGKDHDESCDASNELSAENSNAIRIEFISETENASIKVIEPEESLAAEMSDEISAQMAEDAVYENQIITSQKNSEVDSDQFVANSIASHLKKQAAAECVVPVHLDNFVATCNSENRNIRIDNEFGSDKVVVTNVSIANSIATPLKMQVAVECTERESVYSDKVGATHCSDSPNAETDNGFVSDNTTHSSDNPTAETDDEFDSDNVVDDPNSETDEEFDSDTVATHSSDDSDDETNEFDSDEELVNVHLTKAEVPISSVEGPEDLIETEVPISDDIDTEGTEETDPNSETDDELDSDNVATHSSDDSNDEYDSDDELVDVQLTEAEIPISSVGGPGDVNLTETEVPTSYIDRGGTGEAEFFYENKTQKSAKQINSSLPIDSICGDKTPGYHPMSPLGADSISGQFPRPTQSTPKQASSKKQATSEKLTLPAYINENIDISWMQLESKMENVKKDKSTTEVDDLQKSLSKKSLRELNKMLKEKLQITNKKNNEDHNATNRRPALLENVMAPADPNEIN